MTPLPHVDISSVEQAAERIAQHIHRTPVATSASLERELGARVFFKCENLQKVGAFKARGALNAVLQLVERGSTAGVVTHSSGNHGAALAYAAGRVDLPCVVVMPATVSFVKVEAVRGYGAEVVFCAHEEREDTAAAVQQERGAVLVHPYNDPAVIAGQGTAALELLEDVAGLDVVVAPVGGGGLLSGTCVAVRNALPDARIVGAEPAAVDDAYRSLASGELQPAVSDPDTIADGLLTGLGSRTFDILRAAGAEIVTVTEAAIVDAALFHLHRMKLLVEPSGATALAAIRKVAPELRGATVGVILSGGNTDLSWLPR